MRMILIIAGKELLLRWRDRLGFFWWMVGFPLLIAVLIGTMFASVLEGPSNPMPIAVIDEAGTELSKQFAEVLSRSSAVEATFTDRVAGQAAVRRGDLSAVVVLKEDFRLSPAVFWGQPLPLAIGVDPVRQAELAYLKATLHATSMSVLRTRWMDPETRPALIDAWLEDLGYADTMSPVTRRSFETALMAVDRYLSARMPGGGMGESPADPEDFGRVDVIEIDAQRTQPASPFEICFPLGIIWGLLGLAVEFAMAFVHEREAGTLIRLRVAPLSRWQLFAGGGVASLLASIGVMVFLLLVGWLAFDVRVQSPGGLAMAILSVGLCFVGITMLLPALGRTESAVGGAAWACLLVMAMLGGGMIPEMFLPVWMETASHVSFVKWALLALEGGIWRGLSLREMLMPCGILVGQGALAGAAGYFLLSRGDR